LDYPASFQHTVTGDYYFYALFMKDEEPEPEQVLIKTNSDRGGLTKPAVQYYAKGSRVTITATPWSGYNFVEWRLGGRDGHVVSSSASYTFTANSSVTYWAIFEEKPEEKPEETYPVHIKVSTDGKCQYVLSHSTASGGSQVSDTRVTSATTTKDWNLPKGAVIQVVGQNGSSEFNKWEYTVNGEYTATTEHQVQFVVPGALDIDIKAVSKQATNQEIQVRLSVGGKVSQANWTVVLWGGANKLLSLGKDAIQPEGQVQTLGTWELVVGTNVYLMLENLRPSRITTAHYHNGQWDDQVVINDNRSVAAIIDATSVGVDFTIII
jgi:hypothetical protein